MDNVKKIAESANVHVEIGGEAEVCEIQLPRIVLSLVMAFAIIYFILIWHFRKVKTATLLFATLSLCAFGTGFSMVVVGLDFSVTCVLGIVSLL